MFSQSPIFQGQGMEAEKSRSQADGINSMRGMGRQTKPRWVNHRQERPTSPPPSLFSLHAHPEPASIGTASPGSRVARPTEWEPKAERSEARSPGTAGAWELEHLGKTGRRQRACARLPGGAGALVASREALDLVLRVGALGASWVVLAAGEKGGGKGDAIGAGLLRRADLLL